MIREYRDLKILDVVWVSGPRLTIGLVMVENKVGVRKVYIGPGAGRDEDEDIRSICEWSGKLQPRSIENLFKHFGGEINPDEDWDQAISELQEVYNLKDYPHNPQAEAVRDSMTPKQRQVLKETAGFMARNSGDKVIMAVGRIRKQRKAATGDRREPQEHPAKTAENNDKK